MGTDFDYKGSRRSVGEGYVERVLVRPANEGEAPHLPRLLKGCTAVRLPADEACSSATNPRWLPNEVQPVGCEAMLDH
ncbi:MAG: hypothetical protein GDA39_06800 [Hyphomonadaceae bacterium]|nr:hypothetical protein [Hyphomonadaceae bacterium]MBC6412595.1 hypothetical protein [Hyphomonadaceae bacterium]